MDAKGRAAFIDQIYPKIERDLELAKIEEPTRYPHSIVELDNN